MRMVWKREQIEAGVIRVRPLLEPAAEALPPAAAQRLADDGASRHLRLLNTLAAALAAERAQRLDDLRPELLELVLAVCRELIGREAATDRAIVEHTLRRALETLSEATEVTARLHPDDALFLREKWAGLPEGDAPRLVRLVADSAVAPGECRLTSDHGDIDATWDTQLRLVGEALAPEREAEADEGEDLD